MDIIAIDFHYKFVDGLLRREKTQTIRRKGKCKVGDTLLLRTYDPVLKKNIIVGETRCVALSSVFINTEDRPEEIVVDGESLLFSKRRELARLDGFANASQMIEFLKTIYGLPFEGEIIKFEFLKDSH